MRSRLAIVSLIQQLEQLQHRFDILGVAVNQQFITRLVNRNRKFDRSRGRLIPVGPLSSLGSLRSDAETRQTVATRFQELGRRLQGGVNSFRKINRRKVSRLIDHRFGRDRPLGRCYCRRLRIQGMNLAWGRRFGLFKVLFLMSRLLYHSSRSRFLSNHRSLCGDIRIRCIGTKIPCRITNRFLCDDLVVGIHDLATILARGRHRLGTKSSRFRHHLRLAIGTLRRGCRGIRFR